MVQEARRMQGYGSDFIKEMFAAAKNPDMISFAGGAPAPELYALEAFRAASDKAFEVHQRTIMAYDGAYGVAAAWSVVIFLMLVAFSWTYMKRTNATEAVA